MMNVSLPVRMPILRGRDAAASIVSTVLGVSNEASFKATTSGISASLASASGG
jgi:hypothetical protein